MKVEIGSLLEQAPLIALVESEDADTAVRTSRALVAGGVTIVEVLFRTDAALDCLSAVAREVPEAFVGAGTVLSPAQAEAALNAGAGFIISPGLDEGVVGAARSAGTPVYPGICTATELQRAHNLGVDTVKFFPASVAGGVPALKALSSVFRTMRFIPTGGISADNLTEYLAIPAVLACGGSWLTPASLIRQGDFEGVSKLAREALSIAETGSVDKR